MSSRLLRDIDYQRAHYHFVVWSTRRPVLGTRYEKFAESSSHSSMRMLIAAACNQTETPMSRRTWPLPARSTTPRFKCGRSDAMTMSRAIYPRALAAASSVDRVLQWPAAIASSCFWRNQPATHRALACRPSTCQTRQANQQSRHVESLRDRFAATIGTLYSSARATYGR